MKSNIIDECYRKSIELVIKNSTEYGLMASSTGSRAIKRNYTSVFARDAAISSLGMVISGNRKLIKTAEKSFISLADFQAGNGQIPNLVKPEINKSDFWYLGCLDATLWWLIGIKFFDKYAKPEKLLGKRLSKNIAGAINWLEAQEHPKLYLLVQNEASDWADIMPRSGFVLYSNCLWYWVKKLYGLNNVKDTRQSANYLFYPWQKVPEQFYKKVYRAKKLISLIKSSEKKEDYFLSFVNYSFWGEDVDIFANSLAILSGLAGAKKAGKVLKNLLKLRRKKMLPMSVLFKPIAENSKLWRKYMLSHKQNYPYQYHNGGIWPFASAFWAMALARAGKKNEAEDELKAIAMANSKNNWQFNEWLSPKTGQPMGMSGQSWNAGMFILAYEFLRGKVRI